MGKAGGKILLAGFDLEPAERNIVSEIIESYDRKIKERAEYDEIKLTLKKSQHGKSFIHEIKGNLISGNRMFSTKVIDRKLFTALAEVFEKLLSELVHDSRTKRQ